MPTKTKTTMRAFGTVSRVGHDSSGFYKRAMYQHSSTKNGRRPDNIIPAKSLNKIFLQSSEVMDTLPDNSVHLMVTSPPYNVGKEYDADLTMSEFRAMLRRVWEETYRVLVDGGRACINVANIGRKPYIPLNAMVAMDMTDIGFLMRGEIIWNKAASAGISTAWGSWCSPSNPVLRDAHEYILVFSKTDFSRGVAKANGKTATIDKEDFIEFTKSMWTFKAESARRVNHPAPFPVELPQRLIKLYTYADDVVLDPFMGSGTTGVAAIANGRNYIGFETDKAYRKIAQNRLNELVL